eukprot:11712468-Prorocentrum_lima.AAC.1
MFTPDNNLRRDAAVRVRALAVSMHSISKQIRGLRGCTAHDRAAIIRPYAVPVLMYMAHVFPDVADG